LRVKTRRSPGDLGRCRGFWPLLLQLGQLVGRQRRTAAARVKGLGTSVVAPIRFHCIIKSGRNNYAEGFWNSVACNCHVRWLGRGEGGQSPTESLGVLSNRPASGGNMRLRSGKSDVPKGSVVPRLLKYVQAIERTDWAQAAGSNQLAPSAASAPPILLGLAPHHWGLSVFDLNAMR